MVVSAFKFFLCRCLSFSGLQASLHFTKVQMTGSYIMYPLAAVDIRDVIGHTEQ